MSGTATADADFAARTDPYRRELLAHCYRMLGSIHDAEDLVQDTYLRAWRAFDRFEGRSSVRTWLYSIATRVCLTALEGRARRPLPSGLSGPAEDFRQGVAAPELSVPWLQPFPDPAGVVAAQVGVRLAYVAALQHLTARQRAVLILRDVLAWPAGDVAEALDTSTVSVNSALRRARARLGGAGLVVDELAEPDDLATRDALDAFATAFEAADIGGLVRLLAADVTLEMPPIRTWFAGREAVGGFFGSRVLREPGQWRTLATRANGQPAYVDYGRAADGTYHAHGVMVLSLHDGLISRIVAFIDADLPERFGLPTILPA